MRRLAGLVVLALVASVLGIGAAGSAGAGENGGAVVGGDPVAPGEGASTVALVYDPEFFGSGDPLLNQQCGGTLVAPDLVLTAAHCVEAPGDLSEFPYLSVLAGTADLDGAVTDDLVSATAVAIHPDAWSSWLGEGGQGGIGGDDVAVVRLAEPVPGVPTADLADDGQGAAFDAGSPVQVFGFGDTSSDPNQPDYATYLQVADLEVVDPADCAETYRQHARIELDVEGTICAAGAGTSACYGDSGGPLVADVEGEPVQVGVVSGGYTCDTSLYPGLFAAVVQHTPVIETIADEPFTDVDVAHPFVWEISWLVSRGIAEGYADGTFGGSRPVSRAATAAYLYRLAGEPSFTPPSTPSFRDVRSTHPFFAEVEWLADEGITQGYADGRFRPAAPVSRAAMAAYLYRFAGEPGESSTQYFADVSPSHPFFGEIGWAASAGVVRVYEYFPGEPAYDRFRPQAATSRQAMAAFLMRFDDVAAP
jgi:secreted trypsin-like serine protease